ncbi:DUF6924 domain-containing protein [Streptomyces canus]|uniref:DUF6924 domain-containing protein n=1 Tax=Streptomyces canus TaxID=58343 RepID=UPI003F4D5D68
MNQLPCTVEALVVRTDFSATAASTERPLVVVDLRAERGRCVRVVAAELWSIENNLSSLRQAVGLDLLCPAGACGGRGQLRDSGSWAS